MGEQEPVNGDVKAVVGIKKEYKAAQTKLKEARDQQIAAANTEYDQRVKELKELYIDRLLETILSDD